MEGIKPFRSPFLPLMGPSPLSRCWAPNFAFIGLLAQYDPFGCWALVIVKKWTRLIIYLFFHYIKLATLVKIKLLWQKNNKSYSKNNVFAVTSIYLGKIIVYNIHIAISNFHSSFPIQFWDYILYIWFSLKIVIGIYLLYLSYLNITNNYIFIILSYIGIYFSYI